jgi:hypothetical protein
MFSRNLTKLLVTGATAFAIGGGTYGIVSATRGPQRGIQRSVWTGRRGVVRHGRQRVQVELHNIDFSGSEGDRQEGALYEISEGDKFELGECHQERRKRPRTRDDQWNDHHGQQGRRANDWRRRIYNSLGVQRGPVPAWCTVHVKAGRSDPSGLQPGLG